MENVLLIGLDNLSKEILEQLSKSSYIINGFDFEIDKINLYRNLIENSSLTPLHELLKKSNIIILNISYSKYNNIFKLLPFINTDTLIINTNTCKTETGKIKSILNNKADNFIPCNFLLFPKNVIINCDKSTTMNCLKKVSKLFNSLSIKTSALEPNENDLIFCKIFHIPFLLEKIFLKNNKNRLLSLNLNYSLTEEDIIFNKNLIAENLLKIFDFLNYKNFKVFDLIKDNYLNNNSTTQEIDDEKFEKLIFEKILSRTLLSKNIEYYSSKILNFDSDLYSFETLNGYYLKNKEMLEIKVLTIKEKINNIILFLGKNDIDRDKLVKYLQVL